MTLGTIGGIIAGGLGVAVFNQIAQWGRDTLQKKSENKSFVMKERLKMYPALNNELGYFNFVMNKIHNLTIEYIENIDFNRSVTTEKKRQEEVLKKMEKAKLDVGKSIDNLNFHIFYFPVLMKNYRIINKLYASNLDFQDITNRLEIALESSRNDLVDQAYKELYISTCNKNYTDYRSIYIDLILLVEKEMKKTIKYLEGK